MNGARVPVDLPRERTRILAGMAAAAAFSVIWVYLGIALWPEAAPRDGSLSARLAYASACEIFVALTLLVGVARVANRRFFSDAHIDGSAPEAGSSLDIDVRYVRNTSEQALLALVGHLSLAATVPTSELHVVPVLVALFVLARISFLIGYHISPAARAFGFAATFHPTVGVFVYVIWDLVGGA